MGNPLANFTSMELSRLEEKGGNWVLLLLLSRYPLKEPIEYPSSRTFHRPFLSFHLLSLGPHTSSSSSYFSVPHIHIYPYTAAPPLCHSGAYDTPHAIIHRWSSHPRQCRRHICLWGDRFEEIFKILDSSTSTQIPSSRSNFSNVMSPSVSNIIIICIDSGFRTCSCYIHLIFQ